MTPFLNATAAFLTGDVHPNTRALCGVLEELDTRNVSAVEIASPSAPEVCKHLPEALRSENSVDLVDALAEIADELPWWEAPEGKLTAAMDDRNAAVEICGPDGLFSSEKLRFGAFLIAPDTTYPLHSHAAEEFYVPISGTGQWQFETGPFEVHPPGSILHVPSWQPHALRAGTDPLLMLWAWFGDLSFEAYRIESRA